MRLPHAVKDWYASFPWASVDELNEKHFGFSNTTAEGLVVLADTEPAAYASLAALFGFDPTLVKPFAEFANVTLPLLWVSPPPDAYVWSKKEMGPASARPWLPEDLPVATLKGGFCVSDLEQKPNKPKPQFDYPYLFKYLSGAVDFLGKALPTSGCFRGAYWGKFL